MAIDGDRIKEHKGTIVRAVLNEELPGVFVTVKRSPDLLNSVISFTYYSPECYEDPFDPTKDNYPKPGETPESIKKLYEDFNIKNHSGLVGRNVTGLYFFDMLVGIKKNEEF